MSTGGTRPPAAPQIESISAVTLATHDMARAVRFYSALGFPIRYGGASAVFTSFHAGRGYLNLIAAPNDQRWSWWGRVIFYVSDVDGMYRHAVAQGLQPQFAPRDAEWGEHHFHITDPDGHELSFAKPQLSDKHNLAPVPSCILPGAPEFNRKVPTLKDGDFVLGESLAIMAYLDRKCATPPLFGRTERETARATR